MYLIPEIYSHQLEATKAFYVDVLGFSVAHRLEGYYHLLREEGERLLLCQADSPFVDPLFRPAFSGQGMILHLQTDDVAGLYEKACRLAPKAIVLPIVSEETNGRHFSLKDPNGVIIDIVQGGDL